MKFKILVRISFILMTFLTFCQKQDERQLVESFFHDVFSRKKSLNDISQEYRYKSDKEESSNEKFIKHIQYLQIDKKHLFSKIDNIKIESLEDSNLTELWRFEKEKGEKIFVVSSDNKIETYVLLRYFKIKSFVYFRKGRDNSGFFIPYWAKLKD